MMSIAEQFLFFSMKMYVYYTTNFNRLHMITVVFRKNEANLTKNFSVKVWYQ